MDKYILDREDGTEEIFEREITADCKHELYTNGWPSLPGEPGVRYQRGVCHHCSDAFVEKKTEEQKAHLAFYKLIERRPKQ